MRIIGGQFRGREITAPKSRDVRPMTDHDREALFNILGNIDGYTVLDAYAGSGAMGLEALSRDAARVDGVEAAHGPAKTIFRNIEKLAVQDQYKLHRQRVESWIEQYEQKVDSYDLALADPPFEELDLAVLEQLGHFLKSGGIMAVKHSTKENLPKTLGKLHQADSRRYGDSAITFYRKS